MEVKLFWTETARLHLEDIFNYYRNEAGVRVAQKVVNQIFDRTSQLENFPKSGAKEPLLASRELEYRYLVEGNYKIVYWIENSFVKIAAVFDCRQNPLNLKV